MRAFIAIELDEEIRAKYAELQSRLKRSRANVKWTDPAIAHLTMKFLGEVDESLVPELLRIMTDVCGGQQALALEVGGAGSFPSGRRPRVVWVGVDEPTGGLASIAQGLNDRLAPLGIERETKPFHAHITLGRARDRKRLDSLVAAIAREQDTSLGKQSASELVLFRSDLSSKGPTYTAVGRVSLSGAG